MIDTKPAHPLFPSSTKKRSTESIPTTRRLASPNQDVANEAVVEMVANAYASRQEFLKKFADPRRDIYKECGFPEGYISPQLYWNMYEREAICARVVELEPKESWQVVPQIFEDEDSKSDTEFEKAFAELAYSLRGEGTSYFKGQQSHPLWEYLIRADILSGIGTFGVVLIGLNDGLPLSVPAFDNLSEEAAAEVRNLVANERPKTLPLTRSLFPEKNKYGSGGNYRGENDLDTTTNVQTHEQQEALVKQRLDMVMNRSPGDLFKQPQSSTGYTPPLNTSLGADDQYWNTLQPTSASSLFSGSVGAVKSKKGKKGKVAENKLLFLRVFAESQVQIIQVEGNINSPRFGKPIRYLITMNNPTDARGAIGLTVSTLMVHWTRVVHIVDNLESSEIFGAPRQRCVLNNLITIQKILHGSGEMYWAGAFPGLSLETNPQLGGDVEVDVASLQDMMYKYNNGLQKWLQLSGMSAKTLSPNITDPTAYYNTQVEAICIKKGCPIRVFKGSERGELASGQDDDAWNDRLKFRQDNQNTPHIVVPTIDRFINLGILPEPEQWDAQWPDLTSLGKAAKATIAGQMTTALQGYVSANIETIVTPLDFLVRVLGFTEKEAQSIIDNAAKAVEAQEQMTAPPPEEGQPPEGGEGGTPPEGSGGTPAGGSGGTPAGGAATEEEGAYNPWTQNQDLLSLDPLLNCGGKGGKPGPCPQGVKMYRGEGQGADTTSGFEWFSETPNLATKYAEFRGGKIKEQLVSYSTPFMIENPKAVLGAGSFFAKAADGVKANIPNLDKSKVMEARNTFLKHFGTTPQEVVDYWSSPKAKEVTRHLLESLGYDAIHMVEGGEGTIALLRSSVTKNEESDLDPLLNCGGKGGKPGPCPDPTKPEHTTDHHKKGEETNTPHGKKPEEHTPPKTPHKEVDAKGIDKATGKHHSEGKRDGEEGHRPIPRGKDLTNEGVHKDRAATMSKSEIHDAISWHDGMTFNVGSNKPNGGLPEATRPVLNPLEKGALQKYSYLNDLPLNQSLRNPEKVHQPDGTLVYTDNHGQKASPPYKKPYFDEMHGAMQSAMAKAPVMEKPIRVVRGMKLPDEAAAKFAETLIQKQKDGTPHTFDGYISTARPTGLLAKVGLDSGIPPAFKGNVSLQINAVHGLDMKPYSQLSGESEFLMNHGSQFKVKSVVKKKDGWHVELDQLPPTKQGQKS